ncbi:MAG: hypothetical protein M0C28_43350 [Candidatus Moduliflexus flocculans]|nr:hypothetical protein [Candidatus Moduliflexus flocculans]
MLNLYRDGLAAGKPASWEDLPKALKEVIDPLFHRLQGMQDGPGFAGLPGMRHPGLRPGEER